MIFHEGVLSSLEEILPNSNNACYFYWKISFEEQRANNDRTLPPKTARRFTSTKSHLRKSDDPTECFTSHFETTIQRIAYSISIIVISIVLKCYRWIIDIQLLLFELLTRTDLSDD